MVYLKSFCPVNTQLLSCVYSKYFHDWEVKAAKPKCYHLKPSKSAGYIRRLTTLITGWWAWRTDSSGPPEAHGSHIYDKVLPCQDTPEHVWCAAPSLPQRLSPSATEGIVGPKSHNARGISSPGIMYILKKSKIKVAVHTRRLHWQLRSLPTVHKTLIHEHLQF